MTLFFESFVDELEKLSARKKRRIHWAVPAGLGLAGLGAAGFGVGFHKFHRGIIGQSKAWKTFRKGLAQGRPTRPGLMERYFRRHGRGKVVTITKPEDLKKIERLPLNPIFKQVVQQQAPEIIEKGENAFVLPMRGGKWLYVAKAGSKAPVLRHELGHIKGGVPPILKRNIGTRFPFFGSWRKYVYKPEVEAWRKARSGGRGGRLRRGVPQTEGRRRYLEAQRNIRRGALGSYRHGEQIAKGESLAALGLLAGAGGTGVLAHGLQKKRKRK